MNDWIDEWMNEWMNESLDDESCSFGEEAAEFHGLEGSLWISRRTMECYEQLQKRIWLHGPKQITKQFAASTKWRIDTTQQLQDWCDNVGKNKKGFSQSGRFSPCLHFSHLCLIHSSIHSSIPSSNLLVHRNTSCYFVELYLTIFLLI